VAEARRLFVPPPTQRPFAHANPSVPFVPLVVEASSPQNH